VAVPIFAREGEAYLATGIARGPWDPTHCHGGAPAALLAALVDQAPSPVPMQGVRLTYDLVRPVPIDVPLTAHLRTLREGRRVQVLDAELAGPDGQALIRLRALRIRTTEITLPDGTSDVAAPPEPAPAQLSRWAPGDGWPTEGFWTAVDVRFVQGDLGERGRGIAWLRVTAPLADGIPLSPLARVAAAADFGNGAGPPLPLGDYLYINPDLTVDLHRLPAGEWIGLDATSVAQPEGVGLTTSTLYDERSRIGTAMQSLYVDTR
jgi:hypothetical protein